MIRSVTGDGSRRNDDYEFTSAVLGPGALVVPWLSGPVFTKADRVDQISVQPGAHQGFAHRQGAALAKGAIIFLGPPLVTMPLDQIGRAGCRLRAYVYLF